VKGVVGVQDELISSVVVAVEVDVSERRSRAAR